MLFDTTKVPVDRLESYVTHCKRMRAGGIEPTREGVQIRPAAHSQMGGVAHRRQRLDRRCPGCSPVARAGGRRARRQPAGRKRRFRCDGLRRGCRTRRGLEP